MNKNINLECPIINDEIEFDSMNELPLDLRINLSYNELESEGWIIERTNKLVTIK